MNKLTKINDTTYKTNSQRNYVPLHVSDEAIQKCIDFAYEMTYGRGYHRANSSGSDYKRKPSEIFASTFQGKLAECALQEYLKALNVKVSDVDFTVGGKGTWDEYDLLSFENAISVKSSKDYMQMLLLNKNDFDEDGKYIHSTSEEYAAPDYFVFSRVRPNINWIVKKSDLPLRQLVSKEDVERLVLPCNWSVDLTGFIDHEEFKDIVIKDGFFVNKNDTVDNLNLFSDYYYTQTGDLNEVHDMAIDLLRDGFDDYIMEQIEMTDEELEDAVETYAMLELLYGEDSEFVEEEDEAAV